MYLRVEPRLPDSNRALVPLEEPVSPQIYITCHGKKHVGRNVIERQKLSLYTFHLGKQIKGIFPVWEHVLGSNP